MTEASSEAAAHGIDPAGAPKASFGEALRFWAWLGCVSFGGPAGQIAIMHRELVERRRWISEERFLHALNFCMLLPGPEAQQLATYIGWLQHGTRGGVAAGVLFVLPGFALITAISFVYALYRSWPPLDGVLFGLKAAVLAVVIEAVLRIGRRALKNRLSWWVAFLAFAGIFAFQVPFPVIVLGAALLGFLLHRRDARTIAPTPAATPAALHAGSPLRLPLVCALLWFTPILVLWLALGSGHVLTSVSVFFSKMAVVTFGGAYAVLAYVAQEAVNHYQWISADDMLQGLALAETTPGPLILVLTFVGFLAAFGNPAPFDPLTAGLLGALIATWVTFVPCFLWIFLGAPHIERLRHHRPLSAALAMVTAAVVGVIVNLALWFALHALFRDVTTWSAGVLALPIPDPASVDVAAVLIAIAAAIALLRFRVPMLLVLFACAMTGLLVRLI